MCLEEHPAKIDGHQSRAQLALTGPVEDLKVPRVRDGDFPPKILPYRCRASTELSEAVSAPYACEVSTRAILRFLAGIYGAFSSPQSISRLTQVIEEGVSLSRERPLDEEYYAVSLDGAFLSLRRGKAAKEPVHIARGIESDGRREILGFCVSRVRGERQELGGGPQGSLSPGREEGAGLRSRWSSGFGRSDSEELSRGRLPLCVLHAVRNAMNQARKQVLVDLEYLKLLESKLYRESAVVADNAAHAPEYLACVWGSGKYTSRFIPASGGGIEVSLKL